jgi:hypothetical protein
MIALPPIRPMTLLRWTVVLKGMIRKSVQRFSEKICPIKNPERDDDSSKSHRALETSEGSAERLAAEKEFSNDQG